MMYQKKFFLQHMESLNKTEYLSLCIEALALTIELLHLQHKRTDVLARRRNIDGLSLLEITDLDANIGECGFQVLEIEATLNTEREQVLKMIEESWNDIDFMHEDADGDPILYSLAGWKFGVDTNEALIVRIENVLRLMIEGGKVTQSEVNRMSGAEEQAERTFERLM